MYHRKPPPHGAVPTHRRLVVGTALLAATLLSMVMANPVHADDAIRAAATGPTPEQRTLEIRLMKYEVTQHEFEARFAQLCIDKASRASLRDLCQEIKAEAVSGRDELRGWLQSWYGTDQTLTVKPNQKQVVALVSFLKGDRFDHAVAQGFVWHDVRGLPDTLNCQRGVFHDELRRHCRHMFTSFATQIDQLTQLLIDIGPVNPGPTGPTVVNAA